MAGTYIQLIGWHIIHFIAERSATLSGWQLKGAGFGGEPPLLLVFSLLLAGALARKGFVGSCGWSDEASSREPNGFSTDDNLFFRGRGGGTVSLGGCFDLRRGDKKRSSREALREDTGKFGTRRLAGHCLSISS